MGRSPCCDKNGLKKGPWTTEEDQKLVDYINKNGYGNWRTLPKNAGTSNFFNILMIIVTCTRRDGGSMRQSEYLFH